jgi:hypothetical protein
MKLYFFTKYIQKVQTNGGTQTKNVNVKLILLSVSDSGPPKRPESFLFISLNILKQFIEIRYVLLT